MSKIEGRGRFRNTERDARVIELHNKGFSNADITRRMGLSHNIVAGVLSRWREVNKIPAPARVAPAKKADSAAMATPMPVAIGRAEIMRQVWEMRKARATAMPGDTMAGFEAQVAADCCRYIGGEMRDGGAQFCGAPRAAGRSYCAHHQAACTRPTPRMRGVHDE